MDETRTTSIVVNLEVKGQQSFDAGMLKATDALNKLFVKSFEVGQGFGEVLVDGLNEAGQAAKQTAVSFEGMAARLNSAFGTAPIVNYTGALHQATLALAAGQVNTTQYVGALETLNRQMTGVNAQYKISTAELGNYAKSIMATRQELEKEARARGLAGAELETEVQRLTEARLARDLETAAIKRQEAALQTLSTARQRATLNAQTAQSNTREVVRVETRQGTIAAFNEGIPQRQAEAEAYANSLTRVSGATKALFAEVERLSAAEQRLARDFRIGDISATTYRAALRGVADAKQELKNELDGTNFALKEEARLQQEAAGRLGNLRAKYADVVSSTQQLQVELRELNAQFTAGNLKLQEFLTLRNRASAAETGRRPFAAANASLSSGVFEQQLGNAVDREAANRAAADATAQAQALEGVINKYNQAGAAAKQLAADEAVLQNAFRTGSASIKDVQAAYNGLVQAKLALLRESDGTEAALRQEKAELDRLRGAYPEISFAVKRLADDLAALQRQFTGGNISANEFLATAARARAAANERFAGFNQAMQRGDLQEGLNPGSASNVQKLRQEFDLAGLAAERLAQRQQALNAAYAAGGVSAAQYSRMNAEIAAQHVQLADLSKGLGNAYQRQQILQAGLVNTFQSLAAGQGVFSTLFIQSTQLIGAFGSVNMALLGMATAGLVVVAGFAGIAASIAKVGDAANLAKARIEALRGSSEAANQAYRALTNIGATQTGVNANESASMFSRLLIGAEQLSATDAQVIQLTRSFQQLGIIGGGSTQQISAGMQQFVQALGKGKLDGDELRSIMENLPLVARELARELGVGVGQLREMGEKGQLTSDVVFGALLRRSGEINQLFQNMPITMTRGFGQLGAALTGILEQINQALNLSNIIGQTAARAAQIVNSLRVGGSGTPQEQAEQARATMEREQARLRALEAETEQARVNLGAPPTPIPLEYNQRRADLAREAENRRRQQTLDAAERELGIQRQRFERAQAESSRFEPVRSATASQAADDQYGADFIAANRRRQEAEAALIRQLNDPSTQSRLNPAGAALQILQDETKRLTETRTLLEQQLAASRLVQASPDTSAVERSRALEQEKIAREGLLRVQEQQTGAQNNYNAAVRQATAGSQQAAEAESTRIRKLRSEVESATIALDETGVSRTVRAFAGLNEALRDITKDSNEAARAGTLLANAQQVQERQLAQLQRGYAASNREIQAQNTALEDKNAISRLEALGTRDSLREIDSITRTRGLERVELERTARTRQLNIDLMAQETQANPQLKAAIEEQIAAVNSLYDARARAINDPAHGRLGAELAREQRQAIDHATKMSADFFYDAFTGQTQKIGRKFKEALLRAISDSIAQQVFRPIVAPIIASGVQAFSGFSGGVSSFFGGVGNSLAGGGGSLGLTGGGGVMGGAAGVSNAGSLTGAMNTAGQALALRQAGSFGNLGSAFMNQGAANTGLAFLDAGLNASIYGTSMATQTVATNAALGGMGGAFGPATPSAVASAGGTAGAANGLSVAGGIGGALGLAGGAYGIYSGIQRGGVGGALQATSGALTMGASGAMLLGLGSLGPAGWAAIAALGIAGALMPGARPSGMGQEARQDLSTGQMTFNGLGGRRFSQGNRDAATNTVNGIAELARQVGDKLGGARIGGNVAVGVTNGTLYLDVHGQKAQFANDEGGAKQLAETAARMVLQEFRTQGTVQGPYRGIVAASGDSLERLDANLQWYEQVYKAFNETASAADLTAKAVKEVEAKFNPLIDKAHQLGLSSDNLVKARQRETDAAIKAIAEAEKARLAELSSIRSNIAARELAARGQFDYEATRLSSQAAVWQAWSNELRGLEERLTSLGETTEGVAAQVKRLTDVQAAEYWANFANSMATLDQSNISRIIRANGRTGEADRIDFEAGATAQITALRKALAELGLSAEIAAQKVAETQQAIDAERQARARAANEQIVALDQSVISRILRATGRGNEADVLDFDNAAAREIKNLAKTLDDLGFSADVVAKKIIESEQAIGVERIALLQRIADDNAEILKEQVRLTLEAGQSIRGYIDSQRANSGPGGVSTLAAFNAAQGQFGTDLALARGGDQDALGRITSTADRLLDAAQKQYASSVDYQAVRGFVLASLETLPATRSYDALILEELKKLGGAVNVQVGVTVVRTITEALNALPQADLNRLVQAQTVLRTVEQRLGRDLTLVERTGLLESGSVLRLVEQTMGRNLTVDERAGLVQAAPVLRTVEQRLGRDLTSTERLGLVESGSALRLVEQTIGRNLTVDERAGLVQAALVQRNVEQRLGRTLTTAELSLLVEPGSALRLVEQTMGRNLTADERAGIIQAAAVERNVEQTLGRTLTVAERATLVEAGLVNRLIGQVVIDATGAALIPAGAITRSITQKVETTETVQISRSIDDKLSGLLNAMLVIGGTQVTILGQINSDTNNLWKAAAGVNQPGIRVNSSQWSHDSSSNIVKFAKGGVFGSPVMFPMLGGKTGMLGEAGPEAIIPLKRSSSGELGIKTIAPVVDLSSLIQSIKAVQDEVAMFRKEQGEDSKKVVSAVERTANATEETADNTEASTKKDSVVVGRRTKVA